MIALFLIFFVAVTWLAVAVNITHIPWGGETAAMFVLLILGCLIVRRNRRLGGICLLYSAILAWMVIGRIPPSPDPYATVPPSNTLVIPKKD